MKRKLFLFFGTLIIILLAFGTYQMFVPGISIFDPTYHIRRPNFVTSGVGGGPAVGDVKVFSYTDYTSDGRKRGTFTAKSWTQEDDGSFSLVNPSAVMYQKDGTRTYMTADRGWIEGETVAKGITVRRGRFEGNVVIYFDQSKDIDRKHPQERSAEEVLRDCIRISMNDIEFSQELLELRTASEIYLWSKTVDLVGKGLVILWNDSPRELRLLKILDGDIMLIKELPEQMDMIQLPTQTLAEKKRKDNEARKQAEELTKNAPKPKVLVDKPAAATISGQPAVPSETEGEFEITLTEKVDADGKVEPAQTMKIVRRGADDARNIYEAKFNNNVRIFSGQRKLIGATLLTLKFEWDRAWRQGGDDKNGGNTDSQGLRDVSDKKVEVPSVATTMPVKGKKTVMVRPKGDNWMEIYWDGPLEIKPIGKTDSPDRKRCTLIGEGPAVMLSDADARVICKQFSFENPQQEAIFRGADGFPVRMMLARGDEIECNGLVRFVRNEGKAYLDGPGSMNRYTKGGETGATGADYMLLPHLPDAAADLTEKITWQGNVVASFDEIKTGKNLRPFLKDAKFTKKVFIERFMPDGKPSDYVRCDVLNIDIATTPQGKAYPKKVTASGNVDAFQQGSKVLSRFVQIDFVPKSSDEPATAAAATQKSVQISGMDGARVEPSYIRARGDVDITYVDPKKPQEQPMRLIGQTLDSDLLKRLAVVTGKPAQIWQDTNKITGDVIFFDEPAEAVKVEGMGTLAFSSKQDLSGNTSARPRTVRVKWNRDMLYHGQSGLALFNGNIDLLSGQDAMICDQMKLRFLKQQADIASVVAANNKKDQPLGLNIDRYSKRQIASIEAVGNPNVQGKKLAILQTSTQDPLNSNWLEKRMRLGGQRIIYNALTGESEVKGIGTLMAEDYRLPEKKTSTGVSATSPQNMDGAVDRPSQTVLFWTNGMQLDQKSRHVTVDGDVKMKHWSGNQIDTSKVSIQPMDSLRTGRTSGLRADKLDVWFAEPQAGASSKSSDMLSKEGPQFGPVKQFVADGDVTFTDNNRMVDGQRVVYEYEDDGPVVLRRMLKVFGYLPGAPQKKNARLTITDKYKGSMQTVETPEITYDMLNDRLKTGKVNVGGGY